MFESASRLDVLLTRRGYFPSRAKAQAAIAAGLVSADGELCTKAGRMVPDGAVLDIRQESAALVGRGGEKLRHALAFFALEVTGKTCLDVGASTGGFTQVLLESGARRVFALDVGHHQLAEPLRRDKRILSMEGCNFRYFDPCGLPEVPAFACVDVSFISLRLILPKLAECLASGTDAVCLVKPQFEAGRGAAGKHGVVKDAKVHRRVLAELVQAARDCGFAVCGQGEEPGGICESPILGSAGNKEFLMHVRRG
ncbi:MAG: TlyA family RNA methyltransferase [Oscillospiraceae bacterium]|nr:TlyA family RNA methyltransferase [Oscillospiraceae bacterium]